MRRLAFIAIFIVGTSGFIHWASREYSSAWEPYTRTYLEAVASRTVQNPVRIGNIRVAFFHRIRLLNVRVEDPKDLSSPIFQASAIDLTISLIDLPRALQHRKAYEAIGLVTVKNPTLRLSADYFAKEAHQGVASSLPPWFTVAWEGGRVQCSDPKAPGGTWTLSGAEGSFRIRGPRMTFALRGGVQDAKSIRIQFSTLGQRWNGQVRVAEADAGNIIALIENYSRHRILPEGLTARGQFNVQAQASGKHWPVKGQDWTRFLDEAQLTFLPEISARQTGAPSIGLSGVVKYNKGLISSPHLSIECPGFQGVGRFDLKVDRLRPAVFSLNANFASGRLGHWPFQDAVVQARYVQDHWELGQNTFHFLDGKVSAKGSISRAGSNLSITAENVSLTALGLDQGHGIPQGRVNASCTLTGPGDNWRMAGAWWVTGLQWGSSPIGDIHGDLEVTPDYFQAEGKSENSRFRFSTEGTFSKTALTLDRLEVYLPSGAALSAGGKLDRIHRQIRGTLDAEGIDFPGDLPFLPLEPITLKGPLEIHGRLAGTLENPLFKGNLASSSLHVGSTILGNASATYVWTKAGFTIPEFHVTSMVDGQFAMETGQGTSWSLDLNLRKAPAALLGVVSAHPWVTEGTMDGKVHLAHASSLSGSGSLKLRKAVIVRWPLSQSALDFTLQGDTIQINDLTAETSAAQLRWKGKANWSKNKNQTQRVQWEGRGDLRSTTESDGWALPFVLSGQTMPMGQSWEGTARLKASHPLMRQKPTEAMEVTLDWDARKLAWSNARWGPHWISHGSYEWTKNPGIWLAVIRADHVPIDEWQPLLLPNVKSDLRGVLSGTFSLTGSAQDPQGDFSFHVDDARWRAFQFTTELAGHWTHDGIKPLTLNGHSKTGGDFQFSGLLKPDGQTKGTLQLSGFELRPLGESLRFPRSLEGTTNATFTLNGALSRLNWSGHLEGGPVAYGTDTDHPFKLQEVSMDLALAPSEADPSIEVLKLTEAQARTAEELIRFQPGSFIEFAGTAPARLRVRTEIRNLHLGLFTLFGGLDLDGTWQIKPEGFALRSKAQTHSLFINDYELEEGQVMADYYNGILKFSSPDTIPALVKGEIDFHNAPKLQFKDFSISGKLQEALELSGSIGPSLWDFRMTGKRLDMGILGELAGFPYPFSGSANVQVRGTGDPKHPHVEGQVQLENGTALGLAFRTGTASFLWEDKRISFTQLSLKNPGRYNLEGAGVFPLLSKNKSRGGDHTIDFSIRLHESNLSLLQSFSSEIKEAKGPVEGLVQITGTLEDPSLHGSLRVTNGEILGAHYFRQLRSAYLTVDFDGNNIIIRDLRGKSGEGEFKGSGTLSLAGFQPSGYDLKLEVTSPKGVEVQVPELAIPESPLAKRFHFLTTASRANVRGNVTLRGPAEAPVFSGMGLFSNGHFTFPPSHKNPPNPAILAWFRRITWDVDLKFMDGAWFDNELVQVNVAGNLKLKGPSSQLRVDGGLDISEGVISYLGLQFKVQQARYDIRSEQDRENVVNTPYVRGVAECQIQAVDTVSGVAGSTGGSRLNINDVITLNIDYAPVDQIKPRLTSAANPTMSQEKLLARVTQTDVENLTPQERTYLYQKQLVSLIDNSLTTPLAQNVLKKTGLADRVRVQHVIDPNTLSGQDLASATAAQQQRQSSGANLFANTKYTIEKDLSNKLSLGYGVRFIQTSTVDPVAEQQKLDLVSDVQLSYRWFKNVYLKGDFDLPSSNPNILPERKVTIEPRWRFGWWGNTNLEKEKPK